jgi:phosphoenolpyruvate carboxylase
LLPGRSVNENDTALRAQINSFLFKACFMTDIRKIELPEKDRPLRADVSLLGSLVGEMLVDQHGPELLELVEGVRKAAILQREGRSGGADRLEQALAELRPEQVKLIIQAFTSYLRAVNLAEKVHRIRRRRTYQRAGNEVQRGSVEAVIGELREAGIEAAALAAGINNLRIQPVFTAHPTEATRRTIQEKEYDMVLRLVECLNPELTPREKGLALQRIRAAITSAWQTRLAPHARPTVADELDNILFYITDILYRVVPVFYEAFEEAFAKHYGTIPDGFLKKIVLSFGSWVGGDMDGNPNVGAATILATLAQQRRVIIGRYVPDVKRLARYLSQSASEIGIDDAVRQRVALYRDMMPEAAEKIPQRHLDMPYRCLLQLIAARLTATLEGSANSYPSVEAFIADVRTIRESLHNNRGAHAGMAGVQRLLRRARTFGFHLVTLDVRQDALLHRRVMGELLGLDDWESRAAQDRAQHLAELIAAGDLPAAGSGAGLSEQAAQTLAVFRAISTARRQYGGSSVGLFIISMTQGADDVLTALALSEMAVPGSAAQLDVAPLLETVDDLAAGPSMIEGLLERDVYDAHLRARGKRQVVMVGYSDSNKDSGIVASRWALQEAQRRLARVGKAHAVDIVFFHGRGGTVSRGGGNLVNGILGAPADTVKGFLRLTEQGEVINQKYGVKFLALRNLELVSGAALSHSMRKHAPGIGIEDAEIMGFMAGLAREHFRSLVYGDPEFPAFFRAATPLDVIERLNIGSRPSSRRSGEGIENLRAIPWVFSWAQIRVGFPGVFGIGTALDRAAGQFGIESLRQMLGRWKFFQAMIEDVEMVLAKSELGIGRRYAKLASPEHERFIDLIEAEFDLAARRILELKRLDQLLDDQRVLQRNIRLRNPYVDPIHLLQIDLLRRWREGGREDDLLLDALKASVNGIAMGIQNTG